MEAPCVRVPRERGEAARQALAEAGALEETLRIDATDEWVYIPIDPEAELPTGDPVITRELEPRTKQTLPADRFGEPFTYERLGTIGLLDEDNPERAARMASALMESSLPIESVLNRSSKVAGTYRVREWELLAGDTTETVHREFGYEFRLDVTAVYFSPRLATERHRVITQVDDDDHVFDMFAGVGPFVIPMTDRGTAGVGVDVNPAAIDYLEENAARNDVADRLVAINDDVRAIAPEYAGWANRIVMNLPHTADAFLDVAATIADDRATLHYYDIQSDEAPFAPGETAIRDAFEPAYAVSIRDRRVVRSYAPHEVNVCLDVAVRR